ncbi:MAG: NAD(P)-binding domain-containing protein [Proteobacteria bacterium]|nr:NAD(P)-binding domain-containing protein [Pseudomonadota bacterium]
MTITIVGAGSVGLSLGARLAQAGTPVQMGVRRPDVARQLERDGVLVSDPTTGETHSARVGARALAEVDADWVGSGPVLVCTRANDTESVARALAAPARDALVVSAQNDVDNEERLLRTFRHVAGLVVRYTATRFGDTRVRALAGGRLVLGWAAGSAQCEGFDELARALRTAGFSVGVSERIAEDKWLKLCINLMSAPNALVRREDHETQAFVETKARLLEEAAQVLEAAGISATSCDGVDRDLQGEIRFQRQALQRGTAARRVPLYNQVWSSLKEGSPLEADRYHARILELASRHGVAAPVNARVLSALHRAAGQGLGPECLASDALLPAPETVVNT